MNSSHEISDIRDILQDETRFQELVDYFVSHTVEPEPGDDPDFLKWYGMAVQTIASINSKEIIGATESPIERLFLCSLILGFVKSDPLGLIMHQVYFDAMEEIETFRGYYKNFCDFLH